MADSDLTESARGEFRRQLTELREEHRDLDKVIAGAEHIAALDRASNQVRVQRLKKRKLALKDQIARIETVLLPDIIA
jgi:hypothetical protein